MTQSNIHLEKSVKNRISHTAIRASTKLPNFGKGIVIKIHE